MPLLEFRAATARASGSADRTAVARAALAGARRQRRNGGHLRPDGARFAAAWAIPGLLLALIVVLLGASSGNRSFTAAGIALLTVLITAWSYGIESTMLTQSMTPAATGTAILLELAPRDPRSLLQGDYMALRYAMADEVAAAAKEKGVSDGSIVVEQAPPRGSRIHHGPVVSVFLEFRLWGNVRNVAPDPVGWRAPRVVRVSLR